MKEFILEQAIEAATEVVNEEVFAPSKERAGLLISHAIAAPVDVAFEHICQLGLEGIVSKKLGSRYVSGRSTLWLKTINPESPALPRLEEENCRG